MKKSGLFIVWNPDHDHVDLDNLNAECRSD
jgi:hypothetical protein